MEESLTPWRRRLGRLLPVGRRARPARTEAAALAALQARVDDSPGWGSVSPRPHDYAVSESQRLYADALEAWRKNPLAWRIIAITTDFVVGDGMRFSSAVRRFDQFISAFWNHPKNRLDLRLEPLCDELNRAGDLFVVLFRNPADGMSYLRCVTKDRITRIETAENDWETELAYHELLDHGAVRAWLSPHHPQAPDAEAVMLHYAVNRPLGSLLGESDLTSMLPWLQRYSRMLDDRVRLHWAVRAFLWMVTVPTEKVAAKREQYRTPPESGSIVVKDGEEHWEAVAPNLQGADAQHDLKAVRGMIDAGSGYPPHWRGEAADANLATAQAMQGPTERHLMRRQDYFVFVLQDIVVQAYRRAVESGHQRPLAEDDYGRLFHVNVPDVSREDNRLLAASARDLAQAFQVMAEQLPGKSQTLARHMTRLVFKFAGAPLGDEAVEDVVREGFQGGGL